MYPVGMQCNCDWIRDDTKLGSIAGSGERSPANCCHSLPHTAHGKEETNSGSQVEGKEGERGACEFPGEYDVL